MPTNNQEIEVQLQATPHCNDNEIIRLEKASLFIVHSGTATIEIDFVPYELVPNRMLFVVPLGNLRQLHRSDDFKASCIFFSRQVAEELTSHLEPTFFSFLKEFPIADATEQDMDFLFHLMKGLSYTLDNSVGEHRLSIAKNMVQCFIMELYDRTKANFEQRKQLCVSSQEEHFMNYLSLVHQYASTQREVGFYADQLCITPHYLQSIVRNQTGRNAKSFIDRHCVQEIKIQLCTTNNSLQQIADKFNFPDQSFFTRYFKKQTGMTPSQFRSSNAARR